jgi:hypothetical protein
MGDSCEGILQGLKEEGFNPIRKERGEIFIGKDRSISEKKDI